MEPLRIEETDQSPGVTLDPGNGTFEFTGKSLPEDVAAFYDPILNWLDEYAQNPNEETRVKFKMIYFNTASSKLLMDIMLKFEEMHEAGHNVTVEWHYQEDDEDMEEAGEEYEEIVEVPFEQIAE